jgi:hypothetical protein
MGVEQADRAMPKAVTSNVGAKCFRAFLITHAMVIPHSFARQTQIVKAFRARFCTAGAQDKILRFLCFLGVEDRYASSLSQ